MSEEYRVRLEMFEGPLDLLLFLIRRAEVDITDIPIAAITDQYLAHLSGLERVDVELAGEFLVMAATLMEIKSRMLMPQPPAGAAAGAEDDGRGATDPRAELVAQLLEYKKYREAAGLLEARLAAWQRRAPGGGAAVGGVPQADDEVAPELEDLALVDLAAAFQRIMRSIDLARVGDHRVTFDETPIAVHAESILARLRALRDGAAEATMRFEALFAGRERSEAIGMFLALLELVREQFITVRQERVHEGIVIELAAERGTPAS